MRVLVEGHVEVGAHLVDQVSSGSTRSGVNDLRREM
jgi:hypothetical protein